MIFLVYILAFLGPLFIVAFGMLWIPKARESLTAKRDSELPEARVVRRG